ncbi:hypothetical protein TSUD_241050 [Trifolium subterraneum]|uniref:Uncharacterized protein n=1 Tax=Trifolium subterraneum TaxID=3900 RepID=A0A2Z6P7K6_TRISU|nr:hypothetical protein TSUD_241050 [Trifolium subterraneum]
MRKKIYFSLDSSGYCQFLHIAELCKKLWDSRNEGGCKYSGNLLPRTEMHVAHPSQPGSNGCSI